MLRGPRCFLSSRHLPIIFLGLALTVPNAVHGQATGLIDVVAVSPTQYAVLLENEHVRVVQYTLKPGERDSLHSHPPKVSYVVSGGKVRVHLPGGISIVLESTTGAATWDAPVQRHQVENIGTTVVRVVLIEVKAALALGPVARGDTMPAAVVQRFVDAANARDAKAMAALVAPDVVFARFPGGRVVMTGRDSIEAHYARRLPSAPAGFRITVNPRTVEGSIVVDQEHIAGRPGEPARATWMYEVRGGLIRQAWVVDGR
jgi:quercetin dioxygenase-like cupin family protein